MHMPRTPAPSFAHATHAPLNTHSTHAQRRHADAHRPLQLRFCTTRPVERCRGSGGWRNCWQWRPQPCTLQPRFTFFQARVKLLGARAVHLAGLEDVAFVHECPALGARAPQDAVVCLVVREHRARGRRSTSLSQHLPSGVGRARAAAHGQKGVEKGCHGRGSKEEEQRTQQRRWCDAAAHRGGRKARTGLRTKTARGMGERSPREGKEKGKGVTELLTAASTGRLLYHTHSPLSNRGHRDLRHRPPSFRCHDGSSSRCARCTRCTRFCWSKGAPDAG